MMLDWQQAAMLAVVLIIVGTAARFAPVRVLRTLAPAAIEGSIVAALYSLWQRAGELSKLDGGGAFARGRWILRTEHDLRLPSERDLQPLVDHALIAHVVNLYYATMHFTVMGVFLVWLFVAHRDRYYGIRRVLALATLFCLLIQLVPVAPPRLMPGFIDIALKYHESVYGFGADSLSAMPSVHVCWAVLVGTTVWRLGTGRWRVLGPLHTVITVFVVVSTANHYWADGIVAVAVLLLAAAICRGAERAVTRVRTRVRPTPVPTPELSPAATSGILPS